MNTFDAIYQRRAIKQFDPAHRFTKEEESKLLQATIQAPTSFNIQHWRFVIVRDPDLRQRIRKEYGNDQAQQNRAADGPGRVGRPARANWWPSPTRPMRTK